MYKIGELSKLCRIPVKTLRFYDSEGLLPPDRIDEMTGYRYYSAVKLSDCYRIIALKELGFSLREIKELFSLPKENLSAFLKGKEEELRRLQRQTQSRIAILQNLNHDLKERKIMFDIVIRKSDGIRLAYDRKILAEKSQAEDHLQEMRGAIPQGILGHRTVLMDYEPEFVSRNFDTGLGVEITGKLPKSCGFSERTLSFGEDTASLACACGEYEEGVIALQKYVLDHDYQIVGPTCKIMYEDGTVEIKLPVVKLGELDMSHNEEFDKPFVNDEAVIGHWEMIDFLPCREMFHPEKQKSGCIKEKRGCTFFPEASGTGPSAGQKGCCSPAAATLTGKARMRTPSKKSPGRLTCSWSLRAPTTIGAAGRSCGYSERRTPRHTGNRRLCPWTRFRTFRQRMLLFWENGMCAAWCSI